LAELLPRDAPGERFDVREFYQRVAERQSLSTPAWSRPASTQEQPWRRSRSP
jgi:hypothetical protein